MKNKLVSYCLFTYNQENYIKEAIEGALKQTYSPLEIIISDDCSKDSTYKIIEQTVSDYIGPHKIILNRNQENLGLGGHVSKLFYNISKGDYLITCAGDDISKPNHVSEAVEAIKNDSIGNMVDFSGEIVDENGKFIKKIELNYQTKLNTLDDYLNFKKIELFAPGRIISKNFLNHFEPLMRICPTEDTVLVLRGLLLGGFVRMNKDLVSYRKHLYNLSSSDGLSKMSNLSIIAQYIKDVLFLFETGLLDEEKTNLLLRRINLEYKIRFLSFSKRKYKIQNLTRPILKWFHKMKFKIIIN